MYSSCLFIVVVEALAADKRAKTHRAVEVLTQPLPRSTNTTISVGLKDLKIGPPAPPQTDEAPTIKCALEDLLSDKLLDLFTETAKDNETVYRFGPTTPGSANKISQAEERQQEQQQQPQQQVKRYSRSEMEELKDSRSDDIASALTQQIPPTHLCLLENGPNGKARHQRRTRRQLNKVPKAVREDESLAASIPVVDGSLPPSPSSTYSPVTSLSTTPPRPTSPPTASSSSTFLSTNSPPVTPPLHGYQPPPLSPPSSTTKVPLCAHPSYTRYSKTSFYRSPPRTVIERCSHRK